MNEYTFKKIIIWIPLILIVIATVYNQSWGTLLILGPIVGLSIIGLFRYINKEQKEEGKKRYE